MMSGDELTNLDREALIDLILALQVEVEALRLKLEKSQKPPTNSGNSSQPPSRDWKGNLPAQRKKRRHGPPLGHLKHDRKWVAQPGKIVWWGKKEAFFFFFFFFFFFSGVGV